MNSPEETGALTRGQISYCGVSDAYVDNHWCMVKIDSSQKAVRVYMSPQSPGKELTLIETRTRVTGRVRYVVR